jgi:hypothetical protein
MVAPVIQDPQTPVTPMPWGYLRELALRQMGVTNSSSAYTDASKPGASAAAIALMSQFLNDGLVELQELRDRWWSLSDASVTAELSGTTYPAVLLPADFFSLESCHVSGYPVHAMTPGEWSRTIRPTAEGGGTTLTDVSGLPATTRLVGRIAPAQQAAGTPSAVWRQALWLFPVQTAVWTASMIYRATARNYANETDAVRLPPRFQRPLLLYCSARVAEHNGDVKGAMARRRLYEDAVNQIESIPPSAAQTSCLLQGYPMEA